MLMLPMLACILLFGDAVIVMWYDVVAGDTDDDYIVVNYDVDV